MRKDPDFLVWHILGIDAAARTRIQQVLADSGTLDHVEEITRHGGGVTEALRFRLGDYFEQIGLLDDSQDYSGCMRLLFQRAPAADRYWKDLMANLLGRVKKAAGDAAIINLAFQGDEYPAEAGILRQ